MRTAPPGWNALMGVSHLTRYKFVINGTDYCMGDYMDTPVITQPLMDEPTFGRCCTGSLELTVRKGVGEIPKAAKATAYCCLTDGESTSDWLKLGDYWVSKRVNYDTSVKLSCNDGMVFAGQTYRDKTQFIEWPVAMDAVVNDICRILNIPLDSRTAISGAYMVDYPNDDVLISEILSGIAAAHGGSFIITPDGYLRLVTFPDTVTDGPDIRAAYIDYDQLSDSQKTVSRITLTDSAGNIFTAGDDMGIELAVGCEYATQETADAVGSQLIGRSFIPYELNGAYFNPLIEIGDSYAIEYRGNTVVLIANSITLSCTVGYSCNIANRMQEDDEEEVPYISAAELKAARYVSTTKSYRGNRINRTEGFVSENMVNDEPVARMIANADQFSMQRIENGRWTDCIYFDAASQKYRIAGSVEIDAAFGAKTFSQPEAPEDGMHEGDLWIDSDDNNVLFRYNGTEWINVQDENINRLDTVVTESATRLDVLEDGISAAVTRTEMDASLSGVVEQTSLGIRAASDELSLEFTGKITDAAGAIDSKYGALIRASGDGVEIGRTGSRVKALLANDRLSFYRSDDEVAYFGDKKMYIKDGQITQSLTMGGANESEGFVWKKNSTGLILTYIPT